MKTDYTLNFIDSNANSYKRIIEVPSWCKYNFSKHHSIDHYSTAKTELIIQTLETDRFSIDLAEMKNSIQQSAWFSPSQNALFLIIVLKGSLMIKTSEGFMISEFKEGYFYLAYNRRDKYILANQEEELKIAIVGLKKKWLKKMADHELPGIEFIKCLFSDNTMVSVLPGCKILNKHYNQLKKVYKYLTNSLFNYPMLDAMLWFNISSAVEDYLNLLKQKEGKVIFKVRQHIEENCMNPDVNISNLSALFGIPVRSLRHQFKTTFSQSLYKHITERRILYAHKLITEQGLRPGDVYLKVGFNNIEVFRYHYKKYFQK